MIQDLRHRGASARLYPARVALAIVLACATTAAAPDRDDADPGVGAPDVAAAAAPVDVTGAERLAWSQPSRLPAGALHFDAVVDGRRLALGGVTCAAGVATHECAAPLPPLSEGLHALQLIAVDPTGSSSDPSTPLLLRVVGGGRQLGMRDRTLASTAPGGGFTTCAASACFSVTVAATGLPEAERVAALPDGRILLATARRVLVWNGGRAAVAYDVAADDRDATAIADIAVDPAFADTRFVYLAVVGERSGNRVVRVVRTREVAGRFGEFATLVPDLPVAADAQPALAMTSARLLYLAVSEPARRAAGAGDATILAFTDEGRGAGATSASPVVRDGIAPPAALIPRQGELWIAAAGVPLDSSFTALSSPSAYLTVSDTARTGVRRAAFARGDDVMAIVGEPGSLVIAQPADDRSHVHVRGALLLGSFTPAAIAAVPDGGFAITAFTPEHAGALLMLRRTTDAH